MELSFFLIGAGIVIIVGLLYLLYRTRDGIRRLARSGIFYLDSVFVIIVVVLVIALLIEQRAGPAPSSTAEVTAAQPAAPTLSPSPSPIPEPTIRPSPSSTLIPTPTIITHTVKSGEKLTTIAEEYDTTVEALVAANELANPDFLKEGQVLIIPSKDLGEETASPTSPTVAPSPTFVPTRIPPTFTPTSIPTPTLTPTPIAYPTPVLLSPENGRWLTVGGAFELRWSWEGELAEDEHFDVQVWREEDEVPHGIAWKKEQSHRMALDQPGIYHWRIVVIRGRDEQWEENLSSPSEEWTFGIEGR